MAPSYMTCTTLVFIAVVAFGVFKEGFSSQIQISQDKFKIPKQFGQDLTTEIDKVLKENNITYKEIIKDALLWTQIVYYESDILLDEIENVIPVIDLLDELNPDKSSTVKITLSLPFINKTDGTFLSRRIRDIYYNFEANITISNKTKLLTSLASFTLNFVSPRNQPLPKLKYGNQPRDFIFVNYVKNFVSLCFGHEAIPVGIMWNAKMESSGLVKAQIPEADFFIFYIEYGYDNRFPIFMEKFDAYLETYLHSVIKNATLFIKTVGLISQEVNTLWKSDGFNSHILRYAIEKTSQYQNISGEFVSKLSQKSGQLFNYIKLSWANLNNRDVVVGNAVQNLTSELFPSQNMKVKLILPFMKMEEVNLDICAAKIQLHKWSTSYAAVVMDEMSWRTIARFKYDLTNALQNCDGLTQPKNLTVMLEFTNGIANQWNDLGSNLIHLIRSHSKISKMVLATLIFHDEDIKTSLEIQQVINFTKPNHKIGCSVKYEFFASVFGTYYYEHGRKFFENTFEVALKDTLCAPIFELLDVMIWYVPENERYDNSYLKDRMFSAYSNIFLTKEIFENIFPKIKVYIKFSSDLDKRIMSELFDAPIIVPSGQILY